MNNDQKMRIILKKSYQDPVFFAEHFFKDTQMQYYKLEDQQKLFLRDRNPYKILFCSRRSGKTLTMLLDMMHKAFFNRNQKLVLLSPTLDQAREFASVFSDMILRAPCLRSSFIVDNKLDKQLDNLQNKVDNLHAFVEKTNADFESLTGHHTTLQITL